jgi:hypothetical protein
MAVASLIAPRSAEPLLVTHNDLEISFCSPGSGVSLFGPRGSATANAEAMRRIIKNFIVGMLSQGELLLQKILVVSRQYVLAKLEDSKR